MKIQDITEEQIETLLEDPSIGGRMKSLLVDLSKLQKTVQSLEGLLNPEKYPQAASSHKVVSELFKSLNQHIRAVEDWKAKN